MIRAWALARRRNKGGGLLGDGHASYLRIYRTRWEARYAAMYGDIRTDIETGDYIHTDERVRVVRVRVEIEEDDR